jgi:hypothetical protein
MNYKDLVRSVYPKAKWLFRVHRETGQLWYWVFLGPENRLAGLYYAPQKNIEDAWKTAWEYVESKIIGRLSE